LLESLAGPRLVSATARRHGISRAQLLTWRRAFRPERSEVLPVPGFVPMMVPPEPPGAAAPSRVKSKPGREGRVEIRLSRGRRIIVGADIDPAALSRILDVLERR
jgi:transposase